jgi:uncharacterized protein (TIGR03089 family)
VTRPSTPYAALLARLERDPAEPLLTDVDLRTGERVELSVASAANGVAKAAHALSAVADELGRAPRVDLRLPLHWQAVTLGLGAWAAGAVLLVRRGLAGASADVLVIGPEASARPSDEVPDVTWAARLHPFALPFDPPPPYPLEDLSLLLRAQPDTVPVDSGGIGPALDDAGVLTTASWLVETAARVVPSGTAPCRLLTTLPLTNVDGWLAAAVLPLVAGGSAVLVRGDPAAADLERLCAVERVTATAGVQVPGVPRLL